MIKPTDVQNLIVEMPNKRARKTSMAVQGCRALVIVPQFGEFLAAKLLNKYGQSVAETKFVKIKDIYQIFFLKIDLLILKCCFANNRHNCPC